MNETQNEAGLASDLNRELEALGWKTIDSCPKNKRVLVWTGQEIYAGEWVQNYLTGDEAFAIANLEDGIRALVYPTHWQDLPKTHNFVLDELVCHDFGEPKGQCAICGGYCKMTKQQMIEEHGTPAQFKVVLGNAIAEGSISYDEAVAAISKYELEFDNAI